MHPLAVAAFWTLIQVVVFWLFIFIFWSQHFNMKEDLREEMTPEEQDATHDEELTTLVEDLNTRMAIKRLPRIGDWQYDFSKAEALYNMGLAENETNVRKETRFTEEGDHWLSANRWLWLAALQLLLSTPLLFLLYGLWWKAPSPFWGSFTIFWIVTFWIGWLGYRLVEEMDRLGVERFGKYVQALRSGFNVIIPFGIETIEPFTLRRFVWGPKQDSSSGDFYLPGAVGDTYNPSPGKFRPQFLGKWTFTIAVSVKGGTRRDSIWAWYYSLYEYTTPEEIGLRIANILSATLTTASRELQQQVKGAGTAMTELEELLKALNLLAEISSDMLLALHRMSRRSLAGLIIESVSLTSITPDDKFLAMVQETAQEQIKGEADAKKWEKQKEFLDKISPDLRPLFEAIQSLGVQEQFANQAAGGPLEGLFKALNLFLTNQATAKKGP